MGISSKIKITVMELTICLTIIINYFCIDLYMQTSKWKGTKKKKKPLHAFLRLTNDCLELQAQMHSELHNDMLALLI